ncbi:MAG: TIGR04149 family rSAM-modified RiPP [Bacteroidaceae bacterium]|nr:TIGR04149 family rSAM-modified RiPP [Bacteroidaceae bacterium]
MKKLSSIKLAQLNEQELSKREMNRLVGGASYCCICGCQTNGETMFLLNENTVNNASSNRPGFLYGNEA